MRILFALIVVAVPLPALARDEAAAAGGAPAKAASSRVVAVTVYQSSALVTREVSVPDAAGPLELTVSPLPPATVQNSLYAEGGPGVRILSTRARTRAVREDTREEVRKLDAQIKQLQASLARLQGDAKTLDQNLALLTKMETFTAATMQHLTEKGQLSSEATIALAKYIMDQREQRAKDVVTTQQQIQATQEQIAFLTRQRGEITAKSSHTEIDGIIVIDKAAAGAATLRLSYLVESASWKPQYKLRAGKPKDPITVEYLGAIEQRTGEDWNGIALTLSTAQPMLNAAPPDLKALEVAVVPLNAPNPPGFAQLPNQMGFGSGRMPAQPPAGGLPLARLQLDELRKQVKGQRDAAQRSYNANDPTSGAAILNEASAREQAVDLLVDKDTVGAAAAGAAGEGPTVTYRLAGKLSVPSRNDEQVVEVARFDLTPDYFYKAVPVLTPHVYRLATLTNKSEHVLLPGEATMYQGTDFVGRTRLPLVAIGEQFTAGFGVDPQIQVSRRLLDKNRATQGGNQVLSYDYEIRISSFKAEPVKLQVWDRLPQGEKQSVAVTLMNQKPALSSDPTYQREDRSRNLLRWDLTVEPASHGEKALVVHYEFKMELDRTLRIGGVASK